jgi:putative addiction module CopG family antidote
MLLRYVERMNISLTKHYNEYVEKKVKSGRFESRSEVIRAALRVMETAESLQRPLPHIPDLEEKLLEGLSRPATPLVKGDWQNLRNRVRSRIRGAKARRSR